MQTKIRKIGNSEGAIIPLKMLRSLGLCDGDDIVIRSTETQIILELANRRPKYKLADLVAKCDPTAPVSKDRLDWDQAPAAGREIF